MFAFLDNIKHMDHVAGVFKALSDPYRLKIVMFLAEPEPERIRSPLGVCSADLQDLLGLSQPTVSHHLKLLFQAGLIGSAKQGKLTYYHLNVQGFKDVQRFGKQYRKVAKNQSKSLNKNPTKSQSKTRSKVSEL